MIFQYLLKGLPRAHVLINGMLIHKKVIHNLLRSVVYSLRAEAESHDDLMQEALIHLWQKELQRPGQTQSWYVQSCRFHLLNHLSRGCSIDSMKHRYARYSVIKQSDPAHDCGDVFRHDDSSFSSVSAQDILKELFQRIKPVERTILGYLADGFGIREIAQSLRISHQAVSKHRRKIANLASQLGISLAQLA